MRDKLLQLEPGERKQAAWDEAQAIADEDVAINTAIGRHGLALLEREYAHHQRPINILTHCNAGWLATVDWGTVTAPIYMAHEMGIPVHVWVDETRPRNQGLLTAWELAQQGIPHTVIADNAGGHLMQHGKVDLCIVGTDRTTRDGDVCNKIGTYLKALAAHHSNVPFYVAAPSPSIDWTIASGADIPIEERSGDEVRTIAGSGGRVELVSPTTAVCNPAFDVTPARFVTGIITERGTATPGELAALFGIS
jgi:methylthioribose-1-phosphate isomerase